MRKMLLLVFGILVLSGIGYVLYYGVSPIFNVVTLDEALPQGGMPKEMAMEMVVPNENTEAPTPVAPKLSATPPVAIVDTPLHPASGTVRIVEAEDGLFVRYEDYETINGPDIFVYLAKDLDAKEFINLGAVKATVGNVNYQIPEGVDPREYPYVLTWCKQFGVLFNSAKVY